METTYRYDMMPTARDPSATKPFCITCLATSPPSFSDYVSAAYFLLVVTMANSLCSISTPSPHQRQHKDLSRMLSTASYSYLYLQPSRSGNLQAAFCTNDSEVRIMDVPTQQFVSELRYPFVMNASCTSQDGRLRALVGDSCETLITDVDRGWHSQVVDARNWQTPLQSIPCLRSCVRWLDFTADNQLVMAENDDVVSIYDPTLDVMQDLTFFGSIAGAALLDGGAEIAVSISDRTVGGLLRRQNKWSSMLDGIVL
ncbi:hypothetical protein MRB53_041430 [Persea americana]|nr:hypothetical protein MRB53_041430 [Persea americana]